MQSAMQMFVARSASRNLSISQMLVRPKNKTKGHIVPSLHAKHHPFRVLPTDAVALRCEPPRPLRQGFSCTPQQSDGMRIRPAKQTA